MSDEDDEALRQRVASSMDGVPGSYAAAVTHTVVLCAQINVHPPSEYKDIRVHDVRIDRDHGLGRMRYGLDGPVGYERGYYSNFYRIEVTVEGTRAAVDDLYRALRGWPMSRAPTPIIDPSVKWAQEQKAAREVLRRENEELRARLHGMTLSRDAGYAEAARLRAENQVLRAGLTRRLPEHSVAFPRELNRFHFLEVDPDLPVKRSPAPPPGADDVQRDHENAVNICRVCDQVVDGDRCYTCRPLTRTDVLEVD